MKKTKLFLILCATALLCGCSKPAPEEPYVPEDGIARLGSRITVEPFDQLTLLEVNDSLSKKGLYYATWKDGEASSYENRQGDTVDLYDAQLTFLASEAVDELEAKENYNFWISTAEENYDVYETETITCNEQEYTLMSYNRNDEDSPHPHGMSAFAINGKTGVCIEFTCSEDYNKDLKPILTDFLEHCKIG